MNVLDRKPLAAKEKTMNTFTIDAENKITAYPNAADATECNPDLAPFDSQAALAKLSANWPMSRFVEIWNSIPGNTEVKKLGERKKAAARVWKAIQSLANGKPGEPEAKPKKAAKGTKPVKKAKAAKKAAPAKKAARKPNADRTNKKAGSDCDDATCERRDVRRDYESHRVATAHRARVRQYPRQQRRPEDQIVQERDRRANLQNQRVARQPTFKRRLGPSLGRRSCL
jgi:hypothetical protein